MSTDRDDDLAWCVPCECYHRPADGHRIHGALRWCTYAVLFVLAAACCAGVAAVRGGV